MPYRSIIAIIAIIAVASSASASTYSYHGQVRTFLGAAQTEEFANGNNAVLASSWNYLAE